MTRLCSRLFIPVYGVISELFGMNSFHNKTMCGVREPCCWLTDQTRSTKTLLICYNKNLLSPVHAFILHCGFQNYLVSRFIAWKDHMASF